MALETVTLAYVQLGGSFSLHSFCSKVSLKVKAKEENVTTFGDAWEDALAGVLSFDLQIDGFNDYADDSVDETMFAYLIARTNIALEIRKSSASVSATNPKYTGNLVPIEWNPFDVGVGEVSKMNFTWPGSGALTRATS